MRVPQDCKGGITPSASSTQVSPSGRHVLEERRHLPFQVLDASAIEGIRGLVGDIRREEGVGGVVLWERGAEYSTIVYPRDTGFAAFKGHSGGTPG